MATSKSTNCQHCQRPLWNRGQHTYCSQACRFGWQRAHTTRYLQIQEGGRWQYAHRVVAERILGRPLGKAVVHHLGRKADNTRIVICEDQAYHLLLHARARVVKAGGNPNTERVCSVCRTLRPLTAFVTVKTGPSAGKIISTCPLCRAEKRKAGLWT